MELDDIKQAWQTLDARLDRQDAISLRLLTDRKLDKARAGLRPLFWGQVLQVALGVLLMLMAGSFWIEHRDVLPLLVAGLTMHAYGLAIAIMGGITVGMIHRIDYAAPVLGIQEELAQLRRFYIHNSLIAGLSWWLLWMMPAALLGLGGGADVAPSVRTFLYANAGFGLAGLLASMWLLRWAKNPGRPRLAKAMHDGLTGASLRNAQRVLDEIEQFRKE